MTDSIPIEGECQARFAPLRERLAAIIAQDGGRGAALAVYRGDAPLVDLWGGARDAAGRQSWRRDTLVGMFSVSKGVIGLCMAKLVEEGKIAFDDPVARHWPEFAANGKASITLRQVLSHVGGVPAVRDLPAGALYDRDAMVAALARQAPFWPPGVLRCYHSATLGFLTGEVLRRVTGRGMAGYFVERFGAPLGLDYHLGLDSAGLARCAEHSQTRVEGLPSQAEYLRGNGWWQLPQDEDFNSERWRRGDITSASGHGTPRAIARLYADLASRRPTTIGAAALSQATSEQWRGQPATFAAAIAGGTHSDDPGPSYRRMGLGFFLNSPPGRAMGPSRFAFGHSGAGGALAFGDPSAGIGFCFGASLLRTDRRNDRRATELADAVYACMDAA